MKKVIEKLIKGLLLGAVVGGVCYLITKNIEMSGLMVLASVLSMFAQSKEQKAEKVAKYTKKK